MTAYNVTSGSRQDEILAKALIKVNVDRGQNSLLPLTLDQLAQQLFSDTLDGYTAQDDGAVTEDLVEAYAEASPAEQAAVRAQLGLT